MAQANPFLKEDLDKAKSRAVAEKTHDEILVMAANDLKSPLGAIRTAVDLLGQYNHPPEIAHLVELVQKNSAAAMAMVDNLLAIDHLRPPRLRLRTENHKLDDILRKAVSDAALLAETNKIALVVHDAGLVINCDKDAILQVLGHVLDCAIRYSPENSSIQVESERLKSQVQISVTDSGPAPVGEELRTSRPGFGLCLQISRMLVHAHNGTFGVSSSNGSTRFYFTLPLST